MMDRRYLLQAATAALFATPLAARAQQQRPGTAAARILIVAPGPTTAQQGLRRGLIELGHREGQTFVIEERPARLADLAADLDRRKIDVLYALSGAGVRAARQATRTVPIVALDLETDPLGEGLIDSFARPGGNLTGIFLDQPALFGKLLQLIGEAIPGIARVAVLLDPEQGPVQHRSVEQAARTLTLRLHTFEVRSPDLERVFADIKHTGADALVITSAPVFMQNRGRIVEFALAARLPTIAIFKQVAEAGGLISYGPDVIAMGHRSATMVDAVLKGRKPADIPIEIPSKFELIINLKTAKALGVAIAPSLLARADQILE